MKGWEKVYNSEKRYRAEIVKDVLYDHEIDAVIINKKDSAYQLFGYYEVYVKTNDILKAIKLIENDITFN